MTGTNTFTPTDLQYIIAEIWAPKVEREWRAGLVAANWFKDLSGMMTGGGDTLNITDIFTNQFTASTKSNTAEVTLVSPAQAQIQLAVDTWKEVSFLIEDKELQQILRGSDVLEAYASQAKYIIAKTLDSSLMALYSGLSQSVNDTATDVLDKDIRSAIESIADDDADLSDAAFFMHPTVVYHDLFAIEKYYSFEQFGGKDGTVFTGNFGGGSLDKVYKGHLYGIPVFATTQVQSDGAGSAYYNLLATRDTFCIATQTPGGRIRSQSTYLQQNLGTLWTTDIIYGVKELRDLGGVQIKSRTGGIVS